MTVTTKLEDLHLTWVGARDTCVSKKGKQHENRKTREGGSKYDKPYDRKKKRKSEPARAVAIQSKINFMRSIKYFLRLRHDGCVAFGTLIKLTKDLILSPYNELST